MEERLVRNKREGLISKRRARVLHVAEAFSSGGMSLIFGEASVERIQEIEEQGFDFEQIQDYLDRLEVTGEIKHAAILRGAFNDLLSRVPDTPEAEQTIESVA